MSVVEDCADIQKDAEAEISRFHDHLGPFVAAAEATRMPMVFTNAKEPEHPIIFANDSFLRLTGYERAEVLSQSFNFLMAHSSDKDALAQVEAEFSGEGHWQTEMIECRRRDGSTL
jgi:PAS domain S-box-containing protein